MCNDPELQVNQENITLTDKEVERLNNNPERTHCVRCGKLLRLFEGLFGNIQWCPECGKK